MTYEEHYVLTCVRDLFEAQQALLAGCPAQKMKGQAHENLMDACHALCAVNDGQFLIDDDD